MAGAGGALVELALDVLQDRLAVRVAPLVVAHLAQLGRGEVAEAVAHLGCRQIVVARDREAGADPGRAPYAVHLAHDARRRAGHEVLDLRDEVVGLRAAALEQRGHERGRVVAGQAPALDGVVHRLLHALAREHDDLAWVEEAGELIADPGGVLGAARARGRGARPRAGRALLARG